jgi:hypothetical protein
MIKKIIFSKKLAKILAFFSQTNAFCKKSDHKIVFFEKKVLDAHRDLGRLLNPIMHIG